MSKNSLTAKPHIFTFYHIFSKGFFLLTFPFLQQIFLHPESIWQQVNYTIFNILFIATLVTVICLEYKQISYTQSIDRISIGKGLFHHSITQLPANEVTAISISRNIVLWIARCCRIYISSSICCKSRKTELFVTNSSAKRIIEFSTDKTAQHIIYKSKLLYPVLMSLTQSNFLAGTFALSVIFRRLGDVLGDELAKNVIQSINFLPYLLAMGLPPVFTYVGGFIFAGFLFGLITQIFNNLNFTSFCNDKFIFVYKGLYRRNILAVRKSHLNGVLIKQTLLMCIAKIYTISLMYIGIKSDKNSGVYVPVARKGRLEGYISPIIPLEKQLAEIKPPEKSLKGYLYTPLIYLSIAVLLCALMYNSFYISFVVRFIAVILTPFGVLWVWFRIIAYRHCGVVISNSTIRLNYYRQLNFFTALVKRSSVTKVVITRSLFQRPYNKCHMIFYICDKKRLKIKIKHLNYNEALKLLSFIYD